MAVDVFYGSDSRLGKGRLVTATELNRIRYTRNVLKRNEGVVSARLKKSREKSDLATLDDIRQHICEIRWGWGELKRFVDTLPDSFLDKQSWLSECLAGGERSALLYEAARECLLGYGVSVWCGDVTSDGLPL
jgi:hypothetical protein